MFIEPKDMSFGGMSLKDPSVPSTMNQPEPASDISDHWGKEKSLKIPENWAGFIIKDQESERHQERKKERHQTFQKQLREVQGNGVNHSISWGKMMPT